MKIDLGCGNKKRKGFVGVDIDSKSKADYVVDLERDKLPFKDNSVDEVYSYHFFEHVKNIMHLMKDIYRVCKNRAIINIYVPHYKHRGAFSSPTHVRYFTEETFNYFDKGKKRWVGSNPPIDVNFKVEKVKVMRGKLRFWKPYALHFTLRVVK